MSFCLFLSLEDFKLVLDFIELVREFILLSIELLFGLPISKISILSPLSILPESLALQLHLIHVSLELSDLLLVFLSLCLATL